MHRTQIYLPEEQTKLLDERAGTEGVSRSVLIRRAVDAYIAREELDPAAWQARWREAVRRTAGIAPYLPEGQSMSLTCARPTPSDCRSLSAEDGHRHQRAGRPSASACSGKRVHGNPR